MVLGPIDRITTRSASQTTLSAGSGNDTIQTDQGNGLIYGESSSDTISRGRGVDILYADTGDNLINVIGSGTVDLGSGSNRITIIPDFDRAVTLFPPDCLTEVGKSQ